MADGQVAVYFMDGKTKILPVRHIRRDTSGAMHRNDLLGKSFFQDGLPANDGHPAIAPGSWKIRRILNNKNMCECECQSGRAGKQNREKFDIAFVMRCIRDATEAARERGPKRKG